MISPVNGAIFILHQYNHYKLNTPQQRTAAGTGISRWTYVIIVVLTIAWAVGLWGFHIGNQIHLLLLLAMTTLLYNIIRDKSF